MSFKRTFLAISVCFTANVVSAVPLLPIEPQRSTNPIEQRKKLDGCDILTKTTGEDIEVEVLEVGTSEIKYKRCDNPTGPTYTIARKEVFSIKYKNGMKEVFGPSSNTNTNNNNSNNANHSATIAGNGTKKINGFSIASFILALCALLGLYSFGLGLVMVLLSLIFGIVAFNKIKKNPELGGIGFAIFGIVVSILILLLLFVFLAA